MENVTTSVILAAYNGEKYVSEQLESIISQSKRPDEIIVCDDCSKDRTLIKVEKILKKSNIDYKIIEHKKNQGVKKSFYDAYCCAKGDIVLFSDQDDYWLPDKIALFIKGMNNKKTVVALSDAIVVNENLKPLGMSLWDTIGFKPQMENLYSRLSQKIIVRELLQRNIFTGMNMAVIKRSMDGKQLLFSDNMLHDESIGWLAALLGEVIIINKPCACYRQHSDNVVGVKKNNQFKDKKSTIDKINSSNLKTYKKLIEVADMDFHNDIKNMIREAAAFYRWRLDIPQSSFPVTLHQIINHKIKGSYKYFTSKTDKAFIKDLFMMLFS